MVGVGMARIGGQCELNALRDWSGIGSGTHATAHPVTEAKTATVWGFHSDERILVLVLEIGGRGNSGCLTPGPPLIWRAVQALGLLQFEIARARMSALHSTG